MNKFTDITSIDTNHLVCVGDEGFFANNLVAGSWIYDGSTGDFDSLLGLSEVAFGTAHLYPSSWSEPNSWGYSWIVERIFFTFFFFLRWPNFRKFRRNSLRLFENRPWYWRERLPQAACFRIISGNFCATLNLLFIQRSFGGKYKTTQNGGFTKWELFCYAFIFTIIDDYERFAIRNSG